MELTKEYFDQAMKGLATKADLQDLETRLNARIDEYNSLLGD